MPTYVLEGLSEVRVKDHALNLSIRIDGNDRDALLVATQDGRELPTVIRRPNMLIIPRIEEATLISLRPARGARFSSGAVVHLSVTVEGGDSGDPEKAVLEPIDVSGLERRDLLSIERIDGSLSLRAARNHQDEDLGPLANAARIAAREVLGVQWVDEASAVELTVALDSSGSMGELVRDGSVADLVRILTGVSQVVSRGRRVRGALVGSTVSFVDAAQLRQLPQVLENAHREGIPESRFLAAIPGLGTGGPPSVTYLVTGSVPADLREVAESADKNSRHIIALMEPQVWDLLAVTASTSVPHTVLAAAAADDTLAQRFLSDLPALRQFVHSLLLHDSFRHLVSEGSGA